MNMQRTASFALSCLVFVYLVYAIVDAWPSLDIPKPALHKEPKSHVGMDISHYQSDINWDEMVKNKLAFIFIKATQGMNYIDPEAKAHALAATAKAIPFGYYHFYSPIEDPAKQAQHFLKTTASQTALPTISGHRRIAKLFQRMAVLSIANHWPISPVKPILKRQHQNDTNAQQ